MKSAHCNRFSWNEYSYIIFAAKQNMDSVIVTLAMGGLTKILYLPTNVQRFCWEKSSIANPLIKLYFRC